MKCRVETHPRRIARAASANRSVFRSGASSVVRRSKFEVCSIMGPHPMKFAICNELFEGWPFDRVCRFVREVGYDGLEIAPFTLAPRITDVTATRRAELRRQAAEAGIEIVGLHWLLA